MKGLFERRSMTFETCRESGLSNYFDVKPSNATQPILHRQRETRFTCIELLTGSV